MRVLITLQPGVGHFLPTKPLAQAIVAAGHELRYVTSPSFVNYVADHGFDVIGAGLDWLESEPDIAFPEMKGMKPQEYDEMLTAIFTDYSTGEMLEDLIELCEAWQPDVIIRDENEFAGCIVGELLDIPHVAFGIIAYVPTHMSRLILEKPLAYFRSAVGLPPQPVMEMLYKYLYLPLVPPSFQWPENELPAVTSSLRPPMSYVGPEAAPDWVKALPDRPTVMVTMGTVFNRNKTLYTMLGSALAEENINVILAIGRNQEPADFAHLGDNIYPVQWVSQLAIMPYLDAVVSHGGISTMLTATGHGVPLVSIPLAPHQVEAISRCRAIGCTIPLILDLPGFDLRADDESDNGAIARFAEDAEMLSADSLREAIRTVLFKPAHRAAAQQVKDEMHSLPTLEYGVQLLERLAREKQPILDAGRMLA